MQVCLNGHKITEYLDTSPESGQERCSLCGAKTVKKCSKCDKNIRGNRHVPGVMMIGFSTSIPQFCHNCGAKYPFTDKLELACLNSSNFPSSEFIEKIFLKFHEAVKQLRKRYDDRETLDVEDEYDVQNILHVFLRLNFDTIVPEENAPSFAGVKSRMDFLLPKEKIAIETKMTRKGLRLKELVSQLNDDTVFYQKHPNCDTLYVLVYDPDEQIDNPRYVEKELSGKKGKIEVKVFIVP
jgi:hypothetical protein